MASARLLSLARAPGALAGTPPTPLFLRAVLPSSYVCQRHVSSLTKRGSGGRSSFSGIVATVFGATGFFGRYIVNRLGRVGSQVVVPYRGDEHDHRHLQLMGDLGQVVFLEYNLRDPVSVLKAVQHSNVVINLTGRDYETWNYKFHDVHVEGVRTIAEASRAAGVQRLIHFSALNADKDSPSKFLQSKAHGEDAVREAFPEATIIRPGPTFGHEDRFLHYYASLRVFPFGMIPLLGGGVKTNKMPVYVADIATAAVNILSDPSTAGRTYEFVGPKTYVLHDLVQYLYAIMYRPCNIVSPPAPLFRLTARLLELSPFIPYMTRDILTRLHLSDSTTPGLPGLEDVGVAPCPLEDKALMVLRRYRNFLDHKKPTEDIPTVGK